MAGTGLRERKKAITRELLAAVAIELFCRHGYDAVTVDDVAQAADVSKKTVFNHFPTKEDLVFARVDDRESAILAAADENTGGADLLASFRTLCRAQTGLIPRIRSDIESGFVDLVGSTPALQRKAWEVNARLIASLAAALAARVDLPADDPVVEVTAATLVNAQRFLYRSLRRRLVAGAGDTAATRAHRRDVDRVFDGLANGLELPRRRPGIRTR